MQIFFLSCREHISSEILRFEKVELVFDYANTRDEDPVIFGHPDPVLFSTDPDPTCYNGFIKLCLS